MTDACPHCGSMNLIVYQDRSGRCYNCGNAFMSPAVKEQLVATSTDYGPQSYTITSSANDYRMAQEGVFPSYSNSQEKRSWVTRPAFQLSPSYDYFKSAEKTRRLGGLIVTFASIFYLLSIFFAIIALMVIVSIVVGRQISYAEFFEAVNQDPIVAVCLYGGIIMQIIFSILSLTLGSSIREGSDTAIKTGVAFGIVAVILSFLFFGGIIGAIGGIITVTGASIAYYACEQTKFYYYGHTPQSLQSLRKRMRSI